MNEKSSWDTAIAMRAPWEDRIVATSTHMRWVALLFRVEGEGVASVASVHLPTAWSDDEEWFEALEALDTTLSAWHRDYAADYHIVGGDWNSDWCEGQEACPRQAAAKEFMVKHKLKEGLGEKRMTSSWRHPTSGTYHRKRLDTIVSSGAASRHLTLSAGRSDHCSVAMLRDGRPERRWRQRHDTRPHIARERGWQARCVAQKRAIAPLLSRNMRGAETCTDIQSALERVARAVPPDQSSDDIFDELRGSLDRLLEKQTALRTEIAEAEAPAKARIGRAAWRITLKVAKIRARVRMRAAGERGWCGAFRGCARVVGSVGTYTHPPTPPPTDASGRSA